MTDDLERVKQICWKVSNFIATGSRTDELRIVVKPPAKKSDFDRVMSECPAKFTTPPKDAYNNLKYLYIMKIVGSQNAWWAEIPLWSEEEGMSELYLQVTIDLEKIPPWSSCTTVWCREFGLPSCPPACPANCH